MNEKPQFTGKIVQLQAENVKRLQAVEITPDGNVVVIAGENGNGKSSVLDAIMYGLGGTETFAKKPVREGQQKAKIVLDLGDLIVTRTISANGNTSLAISNKEGLKYGSPQAILDKLVGSLSFDPLSFSRLQAKEQSQTLRALAGLDFSKEDQERQSLYDSRTQIGREVNSLKARLTSMPAPMAGLPDLEISAAEIVTKQQAAMQVNSNNQAKVNALGEIRRTLKSEENETVEYRRRRDEINDEIAALHEKLKSVEAKLATCEKEETATREKANALEKECLELKDEDVSKFASEIEKIEETNRLVRAKQQRDVLIKELATKEKKQNTYTAEIESLDTEKAERLKNAKYPIDGLSVDVEGSVMFNGIPLEQASSAEQLRVSVAIGLALNPKLRVLLIRDGSLLDKKSWALLSALAEEKDAQVWVERVGTEGQVSVVIEDGMVKV